MGLYKPDYRDSVDIAKYWQSKGVLVGLARGAFRVLNPGHPDFLWRAKNLCGKLFVNLNNDIWVTRYKGKTPLNETERAEVVSKLEMVDYVFVHPGQDIHPAVSLALLCRPNIIFVREPEPGEIDRLPEEREVYANNHYFPTIKVLPRSKQSSSSSQVIREIEEGAIERAKAGQDEAAQREHKIGKLDTLIITPDGLKKNSSSK